MQAETTILRVRWSTVIRIWWGWFWRTTLATFAFAFLLGLLFQFVLVPSVFTSGVADSIVSTLGTIAGFVFTLIFLKLSIEKNLRHDDVTFPKEPDG